MKPSSRKSQRIPTPAVATSAVAALADYRDILGEIKSCIQTAQVRAALSVNRELILLYWDIGQLLLERQTAEGWGAAVIPRLARDLHNEFPELKGFSERNIGYMIRFAREYGNPPILQQAAAKLDHHWLIGWCLVSPVNWVTRSCPIALST